jgi:hypothetical protein
MYRWGGDAWEIVGVSGFSSGEAGSPYLSINSLGVPYVIFSDGAIDYKATVMKNSFEQ